LFSQNLFLLGFVFNLARGSVETWRKFFQTFFDSREHFLKGFGDLLVVRTILEILLCDLKLQRQIDFGLHFHF
jgi:hypothetical protein